MFHTPIAVNFVIIVSYNTTILLLSTFSSSWKGWIRMLLLDGDWKGWIQRRLKIRTLDLDLDDDVDVVVDCSYRHRCWGWVEGFYCWKGMIRTLLLDGDWKGVIRALLLDGNSNGHCYWNDIRRRKGWIWTR